MRPGTETLRGLHLFAALSPEQLQVLNELGDLARLGPNYDIIAEGQTPSDFMFLIAGAAVAIRADGGHADVFTDVIQPPAAIGYPEALLGLPCQVGIRTIGAATLIIVPI